MKTFMVILLAAGLAAAQQRFDIVVREDFFAGMSGNMERFEKAMKATEETLANDPNHAEAKVWHGSGVLFRSSLAFGKGAFEAGLDLWQKGLAEMEQAVRLAPSSIAVLIPRGASLIATSRFTPAEFGRPILEIGVADYEKVLKIQEPIMAKLSTHSKGELLIGLADGWNRLGNMQKAKQYFERISTELKNSVYERKALAWLQNKPEIKDPQFFSCSGCHVK